MNFQGKNFAFRRTHHNFLMHSFSIFLLKMKHYSTFPASLSAYKLFKLIKHYILNNITVTQEMDLNDMNDDKSK